MTLQTAKHMPILLQERCKTDLRTQFAALCYRVIKGRTEILLVTSRGSGRWIIPKGWPMDGRTPADAALTEAWEEGGVKGTVTGGCLGLFSYSKAIGPENGLPCVAMVYPVQVKSVARAFPEARQRKRKWLSPKKAAARVDEPELAHIIRHFDPALLRP